MRSIPDRLLPSILLLLHAALFLWAVVGLIEWVLPRVPWRAISNPLFPRWLLLLHWLAVLAASSVFLYGYLRRWPRTPFLLITAYVFMATVCAVETFFFLTHELRFLAMILEFAAYILIPLSLYRVPSLARRFRLGTT
jgi:hypothetical protein